MKKKLKLLMASVAAILLVPAVALAATNTTTVVTPANNQGWAFNRDPANTTPYEFSESEASIGNGSIYVNPIGTTPADKFIAEKTIGAPVSDVRSIAYDFLIAGNGTAADADQFYLNVYANIPGSSTFYDCRFDYVPSSGSTTGFTTVSFARTDPPANVRAGAGVTTCPTTLAAMPSGSTVKFIALNVGDTSATDAGLAGYLDKVVVRDSSGATTYDFELKNEPRNANQCRNNGFANFTDENGEAFKNQGQCVRFVRSQHNNGNNGTTNNNNVKVKNNNSQSSNSGNANSSNNTNGGNARSGNASNSNSNSNTIEVSNF